MFATQICLFRRTQRIRLDKQTNFAQQPRYTVPSTLAVCCAFRNATTDPVCATIAGAPLFTPAVALFGATFVEWFGSRLSRVDHGHNVRLLPFGSRIKNLGC
jgi:hypothetical protein